MSCTQLILMSSFYYAYSFKYTANMSRQCNILACNIALFYIDLEHSMVPLIRAMVLLLKLALYTASGCLIWPTEDASLVSPKFIKIKDLYFHSSCYNPCSQDWLNVVGMVGGEFLFVWAKFWNVSEQYHSSAFIWLIKANKWLYLMIYAVFLRIWFVPIYAVFVQNFVNWNVARAKNWHL